ncbi:winged helix-turn-helix transcriptional regulator [Pararhodobacter zhoushanensis]|uniref:winged helix-turn-helix transcriptional regulator n=1 Tax=Pararhodobacter zhoushanensis TaxID=2479545 RepID=UPI000F8DDA62|nr:helix-turn-helix domain-containing protein [Pararhodobacter zhoushanensis]
MANSASSARRAPVPVERCGAARALDVIGDRWTLLILREAFYGVTRFDDMRADMGIPRSVLTQRLARLVEHGLLTRVPYRDEGARARSGYALTAQGRALAPVILALMRWGDAHLAPDGPALAVTDRAGRPLKVALVAGDTPEVALRDVVLTPLV